MTQLILNRLKNAWQGPPITVVAGHIQEHFGEGPSRAIVTCQNPYLLWRMVISPSLAFGEAYMRGDIHIAGDLMAVLEGFHRSAGLVPPWMKLVRKAALRAPVSVHQARRNAEHHYNIGNDFYKLWLDPSGK